MSEPTQNTTVVADGLARLTSMYATKPNVKAILTAILSVRQALENVLWDVYVGHRLRTATLYTFPQINSALDDVGALIGQGRAGLTDAQYQAVLFLRVAVNRSTGRITDWSTLAGILLATCVSGSVQYFEATAAFHFGVFGMTLPPGIVASTLAAAVPNGVQTTFSFSDWPLSDTLVWCAADGTGGNGVWADAAGTIGGLLVSSVEMT